MKSVRSKKRKEITTREITVPQPTYTSRLSDTNDRGSVLVSTEYNPNDSKIICDEGFLTMKDQDFVNHDERLKGDSI